MAYDLEEQDQLDAFKTWWKVNGSKVTNAVIALALAYAAYQGWNIYQSNQALQASSKYDMLVSGEAKDLKTIQSISGEIMDKYSSTPYAGRAAVMVAKANLEANDSKSAKAQYEWAIKNAKEDAIKAVASLQLAALLLVEKQYDQALSILEANKVAGYEGLVADLKGDVLVAQGKKDLAKKSYEDALKHFESNSRFAGFTKNKLEALGS